MLWKRDLVVRPHKALGRMVKKSGSLWWVNQSQKQVSVEGNAGLGSIDREGREGRSTSVSLGTQKWEIKEKKRKRRHNSLAPVFLNDRSSLKRHRWQCISSWRAEGFGPTSLLHYWEQTIWWQQGLSKGTVCLSDGWLSRSQLGEEK